MSPAPRRTRLSHQTRQHPHALREVSGPPARRPSRTVRCLVSRPGLSPGRTGGRCWPPCTRSRPTDWRSCCGRWCGVPAEANGGDCHGTGAPEDTGIPACGVVSPISNFEIEPSGSPGRAVIRPDYDQTGSVGASWMLPRAHTGSAGASSRFDQTHQFQSQWLHR